MSDTSQDTNFIHLRTHSAYSLLEGALPIKTLVKLALADKLPALALTDTNNLFGALEFSDAFASAGIQPIIGCTLRVELSEAAEGIAAFDNSKKGQLSQGNIALLAKDETGYANLMALTSHGFLEHSDVEKPFVERAVFEKHCEGLICLSGGSEGLIDLCLRHGDNDQAQDYLDLLRSLFKDNFYIELQRHDLEDQPRVEQLLLDYAYKNDVPIVATNENYFPEEKDYSSHDALICIAEGSYVASDDRRKLSRKHFFRSRAEMCALFADLPEAIENTVEIARRCAVRSVKRSPILPQFVTADKDTNADDMVALEAKALREQAEEGLRKRLKKHGLAEGFCEDDYWQRLDYELGVIETMKFPGYFLIVSDFIKWTKAQDIPVGPGRGSGAGSVVAWVLTITDLDPMRFGLLFERFLNPERVSMPDFDIDFCQDRRDEVIRYVQEKYGADRVAQIITFGKLQARAVLRDVGRVLQMPYGQVDKLCKMVPNNPANPVTLPEAIAGEPKLQQAADEEEIVAQLLDMGQRLEGLYRHASTHAAGVVIGDRPLVELVPLYQDPRSDLPATQFNMKWAEAAGLVKFDFLGLKTLTVIDQARKFIIQNGGSFDPEGLELDDTPSYELMARGDTVGVFQLEGSGMRESLRKLKPDRFEDIIAMVALYRPGPMDNIDPYIDRKYGREVPDYMHALIQPILEETHGVIIYQEQVMQVAQLLSGYSLGEADLLRRAMGKKIKEEMDKQKVRFVEGAVKNKVDKKQAETIFEQVAKFAGYGFNKSHAAAYALLAYQTAYLKANHPVEFLAATMTLDLGNTDKLNLFAQEAGHNDIEILPPCINNSEIVFLPTKNAIRYSLAALKNVGEAAVEHVYQERVDNGPYKDLSDFANRINPRVVNKRALEALAASGAFDEIEPNRALVYNNIDQILSNAQRLNENRLVGQNDLFSGGGEDAKLDLRPTQQWLPMEKLTHEFDAVGFFLSGHPLDEYQNALKKMDVVPWSRFEAEVRGGRSIGSLAGTVTYVQERISKRGNRFAFAGFSDATGQFEAVLFSETLSAATELLSPGTPVLIKMEAELDGENIKCRVQSLEALDKAAANVQKVIRIMVEPETSLDQILTPVRGRGGGEMRVLMWLEDIEREVEITLPAKYDVSPTAVTKLRYTPGIRHVQEL